MKVSVVIVSWNGREDLRHCLGALRHQSDTAFDIIVVDNGSSDDTLAMLQRDFPEVRVIAVGRNTGFAAGCNRGIEAADADWVATLNPDTRAEADWIAEMKRHAAEAEDDVGMLASHLLFLDQPGIINSRGLSLTRSAQGVDRDYDQPDGGSYRVDSVFCPTAGAAFYRRDMLDGVRGPHGYFDETFFMYGEDLDLGWRCRLAGWAAQYVPTAVVHHRFQASARQRGANFAAQQVRRNRLRWLLKNGSWGLIVRNAGHLLYDGFAGLRLGGVSAIPAFFTALRDGLAQRGHVSRLATVKRRALERDWVGR